MSDQQAQPPRPPPTEGIYSVTIFRNAAGRQIEECHDVDPNGGMLPLGPPRYLVNATGAVEVGPPGREQVIRVPFVCRIVASNITEAFAQVEQSLQEQGKKACDAAKAEYAKEDTAQSLLRGITPGMRVPGARR